MRLTIVPVSALTDLTGSTTGATAVAVAGFSGTVAVATLLGVSVAKGLTGPTGHVNHPFPFRGVVCFSIY